MLEIVTGAGDDVITDTGLQPARFTS